MSCATYQRVLNPVYKSIQTAQKMPIGAGEWMGRFLIKCADVVCALFSKTVPGQKAFSKTTEVLSKANETQVERMQDFKKRLQTIIGPKPEDSAADKENIGATPTTPCAPE